jgi:hypothetical protein
MQLPAGAQTWKSCGYDSAWTEGEHLAALSIDVAQIANWQRAGDGSRPKPIPRPSDAQKAQARVDRAAAKAAAFLARQRASTEPAEEA